MQQGRCRLVLPSSLGSTHHNIALVCKPQVSQAGKKERGVINDNDFSYSDVDLCGNDNRPLTEFSRKEIFPDVNNDN